jgi:alpha/beta superfamily hydrolase
VGCRDSRVTELIGLGLPVGSLGDRVFSYLKTCGKPKLLVCGELDAYGPPEKLRAMADTFSADVKEQTRIVVIAGADHFFAGHLPELDNTIADWLVSRHPLFIASTE